MGRGRGDREIQEGTEQAVGGEMGWEDGGTGNSVHVNTLGVMYEAWQGEEDEMRGNIVSNQSRHDDLFNIFNII